MKLMTIVYIVVLFGVLNSAFVQTSKYLPRMTLRGNLKPVFLSSKIQYSTHLPISIDNNTDFSIQATDEGWTGNGSFQNPYLIKGLSITNSSNDLITIKNTDMYFEISDNLLDGVSWSDYGILFSNVTHGSIIDNTIQKAENGILMYLSTKMSISSNVITNNKYIGLSVRNSNNNSILNNIISKNNKDLVAVDVETWQGIFLSFSDNNTISDNSISENGIGIRLYSSEDNFISENTIEDHKLGGKGIFLGIGSKNNIFQKNSIINNNWGYWEDGFNSGNFITNNTFSGCRFSALSLISEADTISNNLIYNNALGVWAGRAFVYTSGQEEYRLSSKSTISNNIIFNNSFGIVLGHSIENTISNNSIYSNEGYGLAFTNASRSVLNVANEKSGTSSNNVVEWNDFLDNNRGGTSQAFDDGSANTFTSNYWYEWISPDTDDDGIVDKLYAIDGDAENSDPSPRVDRNNPNSPTDITAPKSTPGFTFGIFFSLIIAIVALRKSKPDLNE